jgi:hypothetical protein
VKFVALIIIPALAGIGLSTVVGWLPEPWDRIALLAVVVAALAWALRELKWTRRRLREWREFTDRTNGRREMTEHFTGFWEDDDGDGTMATTIGPIPVDDLLERLRARLEAVPPGTVVRVDLIAWGGE